MDIDTSRSYATRENLEAALKKLGFADRRPLIVRNTDGRWTAVFGIHNSGAASDGNVTIFARSGFMTID